MQTKFHALVKWTSLFYLALFSINAYGQYSTNETRTFQKNTDAIFDSLVSIRRVLHQHPELSGQEKATSALITGYLQKLGLEVKTGIGGYGVVGILKGKKPGKKIAWRADIDAIPVNYIESTPFASTIEGVAHFCGHDVHTVIGLGLANVLATQKEQLKGTIYFIFQPSEENYLGAKAMIADNLFDIIEPEEIYAAHISPMPSNVVATKPQYLYADYKKINLIFTKDKDNKALENYIQKTLIGLQNVSADSKFWDTRNLMDPNIGIGNPNTIFKNYITVDSKIKTTTKKNELIISTYVSASNKGLIDSIPQMLQSKIGDSEYAKLLMDINYGSEILAFSKDRGNINNDAKLAASTIKSMSTIYGADKAVMLYGVIPDGRGDDFAYFQEQVPSVYFLLGGSDFQKGIIAFPHSPSFALDENCIKTGINYFSTMLWSRLESKN